MKTKISAVLLSIMALGFASNAMAVTCTSVSSLGNLNPPDSGDLENTFWSNGSYTDCYTFSLTSGANAVGGTLGYEVGRRNIDINSVRLFSGGVSGGNTTGGLFGSIDTTPSTFSFGNLTAGTYSLAIFSSVSGSGWLSFAGYSGEIKTSRVATGPVAVAEPGALALMGLGLAAFGFALRRRLAASK